jgi:hypothetical protein
MIFLNGNMENQLNSVVFGRSKQKGIVLLTKIYFHLNVGKT